MISLAGVVIGRSVRVAGRCHGRVHHAVSRRGGTIWLIGERATEEIKMTIGSATELDEPMTMEVKRPTSGPWRSQED